MRATASWPGFLWTTRCVPGSSSCPPGPGTTRTRPTRGFAGTGIPTCLLLTFRPRASARGVRGSWRLSRSRRTAGLRRNYRLPGRPRPPEAFAVDRDGPGIPSASHSRDPRVGLACWRTSASMRPVSGARGSKPPDHHRCRLGRGRCARAACPASLWTALQCWWQAWSEAPPPATAGPDPLGRGRLRPVRLHP